MTIMGSRLLPDFLVTLLLVLQGQLWLGRGSMANVTALREKLEVQKSANLKARELNDRLTAEVNDLQTGMEMVEEKARLELGMVKPNEIYVQIAE